MANELLLTSTYAHGPKFDPSKDELSRLSKYGHYAGLLQSSGDNDSPRGFASWDTEANASPSSSPAGSKWTDFWRIGPFRRLTREEVEARVELERVRKAFGKEVEDLQELRLAVKRDWSLLAGLEPALTGQDLTYCPLEADQSEQATLLRQRKDAWLKLAAYVLQYERLTNSSVSITCLYAQVHGPDWMCPEYQRLVEESPSLYMETYCKALYFVPDTSQCYEIFENLPQYVRDFKPRLACRRLKMKGK